MTTQQFTIPLPDYGCATLILPLSLGTGALGQLEEGFLSLLRLLRRDLRAPATSDPGAIEFDSWLAQPR